MANGRLGLRTRPGLIRSYTEITSVDSDANAFISAAGLTDDTQKNAINQLVIDLKSYNCWSKMAAIYPMVGGTASTHRWNLKDPRSVNAAFYLTFIGGWTHSSTGAKPNGTTGYADTFIIPSNALILNDVHLSYYSRTNQTFTDALIGTSDTNYDNGLYLLPKNTPNNEYSRINQSTFTNPTGATNTYGFFCGTRIVSTEARSYYNGALLNVLNATSSNLSTNKIYVGSANISPQQFTSCECSFASIGLGLTSTEAADLYTAVQAFQTTLGRQV